jgi:hypothetical protein
MFPGKKKEKGIEGDPEIAMTHPKHNRVKKGVVPAVQKQEKLSVKLLYFIDNFH